MSFTVRFRQYENTSLCDCSSPFALPLFPLSLLPISLPFLGVSYSDMTVSMSSWMSPPPTPSQPHTRIFNPWLKANPSVLFHVLCRITRRAGGSRLIHRNRLHKILDEFQRTSHRVEISKFICCYLLCVLKKERGFFIYKEYRADKTSFL